MTIESITINCTLRFTDTIGTREISVPLNCINPTEDCPTFSSDFSSLPEAAFSREMVESYNLAMRELTGHYPWATFLTI